MDREKILKDFVLVKNLNLNQLTELIEEIKETCDKVSQQLPLMLDSFAEVAGDRSGKTDQAKKMLKEYIIQFCKATSDSFSFRFFLEGLNYNYLSQKPRGNILEEIREEDGLDIIRCQWDGLGRLAYPYNLPWQTYDIPFYEPESGRSFHRRLRWGGIHARPHSMPEFIRKFLCDPVDIKGPDLIDFCGNIRLIAQGHDIERLEICYFRDDILVGILNQMLKDQNASKALRLKIADFISAEIYQAIEHKEPLGLSAIESRNPFVNEEFEDDLDEIEAVYAPTAFTAYCNKSYKKVTSLMPRNQFKEWNHLKAAMEELYCCLVEMKLKKATQIGLLLGDERDALLGSIHEFLVKNKLNPISIPTINELGKYKGGFALVKRISAAGGLKAIRDIYVPWVAERMKENKSLEERLGTQRLQETFFDAPQESMIFDDFVSNT